MRHTCIVTDCHLESKPVDCDALLEQRHSTHLVRVSSRVFRQAGNLDALLILTQVQESTSRIQQVSDHLVIYLAVQQPHRHLHVDTLRLSCIAYTLQSSTTGYTMS